MVSVSLWCSKRKKNPPLLTQAAAYKMSSQPYSLSLNISLFWCIFRFAAVARSRWKQTITNKGVCARVECLSFVWPKTAQVLDHLILALLIAANESTCCNECKHPPNACPHFTTQWRHLGTTPLSKKVYHHLNGPSQTEVCCAKPLFLGSLRLLMESVQSYAPDKHLFQLETGNPNRRHTLLWKCERAK